MSKKPQHSGGFGGRPGGGGGMPSQSAMLRQIQKMQEDMEAAQAALEEETLTVSVGGGALTLVITGSQHVQSITINPEMIDTTDAEWLTDLQDLLVAAANQAIEQSQALAAERVGNATGGLNNMLPGGLGGLFG
jgi:DNA-binding YbaB/EbfC family protein